MLEKNNLSKSIFIKNCVNGIEIALNFFIRRTFALKAIGTQFKDN